MRPVCRRCRRCKCVRRSDLCYRCNAQVLDGPMLFIMKTIHDAYERETGNLWIPGSVAFNAWYEEWIKPKPDGIIK